MRTRFPSLSLLVVLLAGVPGEMTAQIELMREFVFRRLERGNKLLEEDKYAEAREVFITMVEMDLNSTERAQLFQLLGFVQLNLNDYAGAVDSFDKALAAKGGLPEEVAKRLERNQITLTAQLERWEDCLRRLRAYLPTDPEASLDLYTVGASAASQAGLYEEALGYILEAIRRSPEPKEAYYQSWAGFLFELQRLPEVTEVLEIIIRLFPDKDTYWKQLANLYLQLNQDQKALATLAIAYQRGFLRTEAELRQLANLYVYLELPYPGALILERGMADGKIERSFRNVDALARSWMMARESDKALDAFEEAAKLDPQGESHFRLAQLRLESEDWADAEGHLREALRLGGLSNEPNAWIMLGYAQFNAEKFDEALKTFERAAQFGSVETTARQWMGYVRDELAQREAERVLREGAAAPAAPEEAPATQG